MKFIVQLVGTALLAYILAKFLPFWSVALAAFIVAVFINYNTFASFFAGFLSIGLLWVIAALIISGGNDDILLNQVSEIFSMSAPFLVLLMGILSGLIGGFAAASGNYLNKLLFHNKMPVT